MYYPDDDTLVIERKDVVGKTTSDADTSKASLARKYKGYCSGKLNPDLLLCKVFYFTFYGSYGCLFPIIAVFFKQLGLSATQIGVLVGVRPFVEFCAAPMWGAVADTWRSAKAILLLSLLSWLVFTEAVAFVRPASGTCVLVNATLPANSTLIVVGDPKKTDSWNGRIDAAAVPFARKVSPEFRRRDVAGEVSPRDPRPEMTEKESAPDGVNPNSSPEKPKSDSNQPDARQRHVTVVKYKDEDTKVVFVYLFLLMILGEFFSSPTITLADSATLGYLGHQRMELYGRQRMFGSLAWGVFMLVEGLILERTKKAVVECDGQATVEQENYLVCFGTYAVLITCAFFVATQFQFKYRSLNEAIWHLESKGKAGRGGRKTAQLENVKKTMDKYHDKNETRQPVEDSIITDEEEEEEEGELKYPKVLLLYASVRNSTVLFVVWFAGFGFGFLFTFLYWHLKELGGPPSLFGVASIINHTSEVIAYFVSVWVIRKLGHIAVLCMGLVCFAARLIVVSYIVNPWWVLAVETLQGVTHALVWAASTSFIGMSTSQENRSSAQGILQGVYHGLGRGCGAICGGIIISAYGSTVAFRALGVMYLIVAAIFAAVQYMESGDDRQQEKRGDEENYVKDDDPGNIEEVALLSQSEGATNRPAEERAKSAAHMDEGSGSDSSDDSGSSSSDDVKETSFDH